VKAISVTAYRNSAAETTLQIIN